MHRISGGWAWVAGLVALTHFFLPFFVLLWPQMQRSPRALGIMAATLVIAEIPHAWWLVLPSSPDGFNWIDVAAMLGVLGLATGASLSTPRFALIPHAVRPQNMNRQMSGGASSRPPSHCWSFRWP